MSLGNSSSLLSATLLFDDELSNSDLLSDNNTPRCFSTNVFVRICPFDIQQTSQQDKPQATVKLGPKEGMITLLDPLKNYAPRCVYNFNGCFDSGAAGCDQHVIYQHVGCSVLQNVVDGYNGCVFAYGQTGSGKTYTILGPNKPTATACHVKGKNQLSASSISPFKNVHKKDEEFLSFSQSNMNMSALENSSVIGKMGESTFSRKREVDDGLLPRIAQDIFNSLHLKHSKTAAHTFRVEVEFCEIYNEKIFDMLNGGNNNTTGLRLLHQPTCGVYVEGLSRKHVTNEEEMLYWIYYGISERHTACTKMNNSSSRSHAIFIIHVEQIFFKENGFSTRVSSKLNLVDLAGSERTGAVGAEGKQFIEGTKINLSLTALGRVIDALADISSGKHDVLCPYRDSKLTWLLMDSLGGNSKTSMVATISPSVAHYEYTCQTLRYASRAKQIVNKAVINEDPQVRQIKELAAEVKRLQVLLQKRMQFSSNNENTNKLQEQILKLELDVANRDCTIDSLRSQLAEKSVLELRQLLFENQQLKREVKNFKQTRATVVLLEKKLKAANDENEKLSAQLAEFKKLQNNNLMVMSVISDKKGKEQEKEKEDVNLGENKNNSNGGSKMANNNYMQLNLGDEILQNLKKLGINPANKTVTSLINTLTLSCLDAKKKRKKDELIQKNMLLNKSHSHTMREKTLEMETKEHSALFSAKGKDLDVFPQICLSTKTPRETQPPDKTMKDMLSARISCNKEKQFAWYEKKLHEKEKEVKTLNNEKENFQKELKSLSGELGFLKEKCEKNCQEVELLREGEKNVKKDLVKTEQFLKLSREETEFLRQGKSELLQNMCTFMEEILKDRNHIFFLEEISRQSLFTHNNELLIAHNDDIMTRKINDINKSHNAIVAQAEANSELLLKEVNSLQNAIKLRDKQHVDLMANFALNSGFCKDVLFDVLYKKTRLVEEAYGFFFAELCQQRNALLKEITCVKHDMKTKEQEMHSLLESEAANYKKLLRQKEEELAETKTVCEKMLKSQQNFYCIEMKLRLSQMNECLNVTYEKIDKMLELSRSSAALMICEMQKEYNNHVCHLALEAEKKESLLVGVQDELNEANKKLLIQESLIKKQDVTISELKEEVEQTRNNFYKKEHHFQECREKEEKKLRDLIIKKNDEKHKALQELSALKRLFTEVERFAADQNSLYIQYMDALFAAVSWAVEEMRWAHGEELRKLQSAHLLKVDKLEKATSVAKGVINHLLNDARVHCAALQEAHCERLLRFAGCGLALFADLQAGREAVAREEAAGWAELLGRCGGGGRRLLADHAAFGARCAAEHAALVEGLWELFVAVGSTARRQLRKLSEDSQAAECLRLENARRRDLALCEEGERCLIIKFMKSSLSLVEEKDALSRNVLTITRALIADSDANVQPVSSVSHYMAETLLLERYKQCFLEEFVTHLTTLSDLCRMHTVDGVVMGLKCEYELKIKDMEAGFQQEILLLQKEEAERRMYLEKVRELSDFEANLDYLEQSVLQKTQEESSKQNNQLQFVKDGGKKNFLPLYNKQQNTRIGDFISSFF